MWKVELFTVCSKIFLKSAQISKLSTRNCSRCLSLSGFYCFSSFTSQIVVSLLWKHLKSKNTNENFPTHIFLLQLFSTSKQIPMPNDFTMTYWVTTIDLFVRLWTTRKLWRFGSAWRSLRSSKFHWEIRFESSLKLFKSRVQIIVILGHDNEFVGETKVVRLQIALESRRVWWRWNALRSIRTNLASRCRSIQ